MVISMGCPNLTPFVLRNSSTNADGPLSFSTAPGRSLVTTRPQSRSQTFSTGHPGTPPTAPLSPRLRASFPTPGAQRGACVRPSNHGLLPAASPTLRFSMDDETFVARDIRILVSVQTYLWGHLSRVRHGQLAPLVIARDI